MNSFQQAIEMDSTRPEGYLGAGWCSILLPDYWVIGDQYDYMAVQQDGGDWPVAFYTESQTQDIPWEPSSASIRSSLIPTRWSWNHSATLSS